jgi:hypothetical protein
MANPSVIQTALKLASIVVVGVGLVLALAAHPSTAGITALLADGIFWPFDGHPTLDAPATRLLAAISGGVMVGWGALLWLVATRILPSDPALTATLVRTSLLAWFAVDSTASILAGAPLNVVLNAVFLAAFLVPLGMLARKAPA